MISWKTGPLAVALCSTLAVAQTPLDTRFTYQGRLDSAGSPATGVYDLRFSLYGDEPGTVPAGAPVTIDDVQITNGTFAVELDFGPQFTGFATWLKTEVRPGASTGPYTSLAPLRELTPAPMAQYAMGPFYQIPGTYDLAYTFGRVGIGREPDTTFVGHGFDLDVSGTYLRLGLEENGGGALVLANNAGDNRVWLEAFNSTGDGTAAELIIAGYAGGPVPVRFAGNVGFGAAAASTNQSRLYSFAGAGQDAIWADADGTKTGVYATTDTGYAVYGFTTSASAGTAVYADGGQYGVYAQSYTGNGAAVYAVNNSGNAIIGVNDEPGYGSVVGITNNAAGYGGYFVNNAGGSALWVNGLTQTKTLQILGGADVAESFDIAPSHDVAPMPGMVVVIDPAHPGALRVGDAPYDARVAGIVSGANGLSAGMVLGAQGDAMASGEHAVAMAGRVWCMADATLGAVEPGALLTTSSTPGHAMVASDRSRSHGCVIGKAMTPLHEGRGLVLVLVNLQ